MERVAREVFPRRLERDVPRLQRCGTRGKGEEDMAMKKGCCCGGKKAAKKKKAGKKKR